MRSGQTTKAIDWAGLDKGPPSFEQANLLMRLEADNLGKLRDLAWNMTGRTITFSRNVTVPVTKLCRNRCRYCGFRKGRGGYLLWREILPLLLKAQDLDCSEVLFMTGERPEEVHESARRFLKKEGFGSTPEYVTWLCGRTLDETDLLPHTNIGTLDAAELRELRKVNASMGLMLEDASERLCGEGMPHEDSPGKLPPQRLRTIEEAGRLGIPFTTGLLLGIGQTTEEIVRSLMVLKKIKDRHAHIQEIIIQRFLPKVGTPMASHPPPSTNLMLKAVSVARLIFGRGMNIQVPPNIERDFEVFIKGGANDLGGVSPITRDQINPEEPWCREDDIFKRVSSIGCRARLRPPVYPEFITPRFMVPRMLSRARLWLRRMEEEGRNVDPSYDRTLTT